MVSFRLCIMHKGSLHARFSQLKHLLFFIAACMLKYKTKMATSRPFILNILLRGRWWMCQYWLTVRLLKYKTSHSNDYLPLLYLEHSSTWQVVAVSILVTVRLLKCKTSSPNGCLLPSSPLSYTFFCVAGSVFVNTS
jgi:hypothetical protein